MSLKEAFETTKLTPGLANSSKTLIEWGEQPSIFKHYPHFLFHYKLDTNDPFDIFCQSLRFITDTNANTVTPYHKLSVPSAGNLHPVEIYLQIRKVPGKLSGIYHLDVPNNRLVLIQEIGKEGVEYFFDLEHRHEGVFIFFSSVYFRSSWKYSERAWRYLLLDMGHQIASLKLLAASKQKELTFLKSSKHKELETYLGFTQGEKLLCASAIATPLHRKVTPPRQNCMVVQPTDYFMPSPTLESILKKMEPYHERVEILSPFSFKEKNILYYIKNRRSARKFSGNSLPNKLLEPLLHKLSQVDVSLGCYHVLLRSIDQSLGIYHQGTLLKHGSFVHEVNHLLLGQAIAYTSTVILFLSIHDISSQAFYDAGILAHELYLYCTENNIGCSAAGAYLDDATKDFLQTENDIIYCFCMGDIKGD